MKEEYKKWGIRLLVVLFIIVVFTGIDYAVHSLSEDYAVPGYYFRNKIIFGTLIGFIAYFFIYKTKPAYRALIFSGVIAALLQIRYYLEGYPKEFVLELLLFHFLMLLPVSFVVFYYFKRL
jgi:hypothetical protein